MGKTKKYTSLKAIFRYSLRNLHTYIYIYIYTYTYTCIYVYVYMYVNVCKYKNI